MTTDRLTTNAEPDNDADSSIALVVAALEKTADRYRTLLGQTRLLDTDVLELALLSANAAHLLTYVEGNQRYFSYATELRRLWERLFADPSIDIAASALLERTVCEQPGAKRAREDLYSLLRVRHAYRPEALALSPLYARANDVLNAVEDARSALLERVGLQVGDATSTAVYYRAVSTAPPTTRAKLVRAWEGERARHTPLLLKEVDKLVQVRRSRARSEGAGSVLNRTLRSSFLNEDRAEAFVANYLDRSVDAAGRLAKSIGATTGASDHPLDSFGAYARSLVSDVVLPSFSLEDCLDYLASVTRDIFGIELIPMPSANTNECIVLGVRDGQPIGTVTFDLQGVRLTSPLHWRNPAGTLDFGLTLPAARVLCRYRLDTRGRSMISYDGVHSIFHEFGHALNHWLLHRHTPSDTGLDYLPVERIENFSTWFEKWVYHPRFAAHLELSSADVAGLNVCARVKRLEFLSANLDRAVVAALDLDVHRGTGDIDESFHRLERRFAFHGLCRLPTIASYLLWPLCRAYPGANLAYIWGAAFGAQAASSWRGQETGALDPAAAATFLESCLNPDAPSREPDLDPLFLFYNVEG